MLRNVYTFHEDCEANDIRSLDKTVVGGKSANLAEIAGIGLPVPLGITITTEECVRYLAEGGQSARSSAMPRSAAGLGPLGARVSMPGMMDSRAVRRSS